MHVEIMKKFDKCYGVVVHFDGKQFKQNNELGNVRNQSKKILGDRAMMEQIIFLAGQNICR